MIRLRGRYGFERLAHSSSRFLVLSVSLSVSVSVSVFACSSDRVTGTNSGPPEVPPLLPAPSTDQSLIPLKTVAAERGIRLGAAVPVPEEFGDAFTKFRNVLVREFSMLTPEDAMKHEFVHPARNTYSFTAGDLLVDFAKAHGMAVRGHTLVWHLQLADWLTSGTWSAAEGQTLLEDHVKTVVAHYRGKLAAWDVVNEPLCFDGSLCSGFWRDLVGPDYIERALRAAHAADGNVPLFINESAIEGFGQKSDSMYALAKRLLDKGVPLNGIGFQAHFVAGLVPPKSQIAANFARFAALGLKIQITELDVRVPLPPSQADVEQQVQDYRTVVGACIETAACNAIVTWGVGEPDSWITYAYPGFGEALMFDSAYRAKPAYQAVHQLFLGG
ncbi:MAG TPA: endo-1,4-beta-xylanase [Gemmatimonadaceae bacterium]|nr:endo-1,4-beta-xylanase [Gemmatimonadaceae bacterium]